MYWDICLLHHCFLLLEVKPEIRFIYHHVHYPYLNNKTIMCGFYGDNKKAIVSNMVPSPRCGSATLIEVHWCAEFQLYFKLNRCNRVDVI